MMTEGFGFAEDLAFAVQAVEDKLLAAFQAIDPCIKKINYIYGRPDEINKEIQEMSAGISTKLEKHPLVGLFEPINIVHPKDGKYPYANGVEIIIAMPTSKEKTSYEREQQNVKPILMPLYKELMAQIAKRPMIVAPNPKADLGHTKTVIKGSVFFNDYVDCIQIKDLTLKFKFSHC